MSEYKYIEPVQQGDVTVVTIANPQDMDRLVIYELGDELSAFAAGQRPEKLVVDFSRVTYCSSEVINGLLKTRKAVVAYGGEVRLCSLVEEVKRLFIMTNLDKTIFEIHDTTESALASFN